MTTKTVVPLCVTDDEGYIRVEHDGVDLSIVAKIPSETMIL